MDRKINDDDYKIPKYQQIIIDLADMGLGKVILVLWVIIILVLGLTLLGVKWMLSSKWFLNHFR